MYKLFTFKLLRSDVDNLNPLPPLSLTYSKEYRLKGLKRKSTIISNLGEKHRRHICMLCQNVSSASCISLLINLAVVK